MTLHIEFRSHTLPQPADRNNGMLAHKSTTSPQDASPFQSRSKNVIEHFPTTVVMESIGQEISNRNLNRKPAGGRPGLCAPRTGAAWARRSTCGQHRTTCGNPPGWKTWRRPSSSLTQPGPPFPTEPGVGLVRVCKEDDEGAGGV